MPIRLPKPAIKAAADYLRTPSNEDDLLPKRDFQEKFKAFDKKTLELPTSKFHIERVLPTISNGGFAQAPQGQLDWRLELNKGKESVLEKFEFDSDVDSQMQVGLKSGIQKLSDRKDPLISSVLRTISEGEYVKSIKIKSSECPSGDGEHGEYDKVDKEIYLYDVNNMIPEMSINSVMHEATHAYQEKLKLNPELKAQFENGEFYATFLEDLNDRSYQSKSTSSAEDMQINIRKGMLEMIVSDPELYSERERGYEAQARVMEDIVENPEKAQKMFPRTIAKMREIDKEYGIVQGTGKLL